MIAVASTKAWSIVFFAVALTAPPLHAQENPIVLLNPSFEDDPQISKPARGWYVCGYPGESPPDVHPTGYFEVDQAPAHGVTYVGLVVRDNETFEALGQRLGAPLRPGRCYAFSLQASRSEYYRSPSRATSEIVHYNQPVRIRIWGARSNCERSELLASSTPIDHTEWRTYTFQLRPRQQHRFFIIEAFYPEAYEQPYRGNVLIDDCSPILPADCQDFQPLTAPELQAYPAPAHREELDAIIARLAPGVEFSPGTAELCNQYYLGPERQPMQGNRYLHQIAKAISHFPNLQLVVAIGGPGHYLCEQRLRMMRHQLTRLGLTERQFKLKLQRRRDQKMLWTGRNQEGDILIRVK